MQNNYIQKLQPVNHDHTLDEVTQFAKSLGIKTFDFPDDMAMKDYRLSIEKKIVDTVHPYKIYENKKVPGQWATYIYDRFRKGKRRNIRRRNYDELIHALTEYYINNYDINITMQYLFEKWLIYRRDETPVKPGTIRKDLSTWNTYCKNVKLDDKSLSDIRVSEVSQKYLARFFRNLTKRRQFTKQAVNNIRSIFSGMLSYAVELELIEHNPIHDVDFKRLPFKPVPDKQEDVFTREETYKLLTYAYNGENLPQLSRMMGHSQVSTTLHYLRNVDKENTFADVFKNLGNSH